MPLLHDGGIECYVVMEMLADVLKCMPLIHDGGIECYVVMEMSTLHIYFLVCVHNLSNLGYLLALFVGQRLCIDFSVLQIS